MVLRSKSSKLTELSEMAASLTTAGNSLLRAINSAQQLTQVPRDKLEQLASLHHVERPPDPRSTEAGELPAPEVPDSNSALQKLLAMMQLLIARQTLREVDTPTGASGSQKPGTLSASAGASSSQRSAPASAQDIMAELFSKLQPFEQGTDRGRYALMAVPRGIWVLQGGNVRIMLLCNRKGWVLACMHSLLVAHTCAAVEMHFANG